MSTTEEKPFTKLFRESGLMDKYVTEFERWRLIDPQDDKSVGPQKTLGEMVQDIAELLEDEPEMQQTRLTPLVMKRPPTCFCLEKRDIEFYAVRDELDRLVIEASVKISRGEPLYEINGEEYVVEDVEELYDGNTVTAKLVTIHRK